MDGGGGQQIQMLQMQTAEKCVKRSSSPPGPYSEGSTTKGRLSLHTFPPHRYSFTKMKSYVSFYNFFCFAIFPGQFFCFFICLIEV